MYCYTYSNPHFYYTIKKSVCLYENEKITIKWLNIITPESRV
jgi:hypothetical protein